MRKEIKYIRLRIKIKGEVLIKTCPMKDAFTYVRPSCKEATKLEQYFLRRYPNDEELFSDEFIADACAGESISFMDDYCFCKFSYLKL